MLTECLVEATLEVEVVHLVQIVTSQELQVDFNLFDAVKDRRAK